MPSGGTAVSAGMSLISGKKADKSASRSRKLDRQALELERERDRFNREQVETTNRLALEDRADIIDRRGRARELYDPLEESIVDMAMEGPQYEEAMARSDADVAQAFARERGRQQREAFAYGIQPGSGRFAAESRRMGNEEILQTVQGRERARRIEDDQDWARRMAAMGSGNMRNVTPSVQMQQLGVSGESGVRQRMAAGERAESAAGWGLAGKFAADAVRYAQPDPDAFTRPTSTASTLNTWRTR